MLPSCMGIIIRHCKDPFSRALRFLNRNIQQQPFKHVGGFDFDKHAVDVYSKNHDVHAVCKDVHDRSLWEDMADLDINVLAVTCISFSLAGKWRMHQVQLHSHSWLLLQHYLVSKSWSLRMLPILTRTMYSKLDCLIDLKVTVTVAYQKHNPHINQVKSSPAAPKIYQPRSSGELSTSCVVTWRHANWRSPQLPHWRGGWQKHRLGRLSISRHSRKYSAEHGQEADYHQFDEVSPCFALFVGQGPPQFDSEWADQAGSPRPSNGVHKRRGASPSQSANMHLAPNLGCKRAWSLIWRPEPPTVPTFTSQLPNLHGISVLFFFLDFWTTWRIIPGLVSG